MKPIDALQATLAGEHAAIYVLGVLGAQTSQSANPALFEAIDAAHSAHRSQRDRLIPLVRKSGAEPVAAKASYVLPNDAANTARIRGAARQVEERCTDLYGQLVENSSGATRAWAVTGLTAGAVRLLSFGASAESFPGLTTQP
ncbi:MAG: DUF4439 domain-containing protein [Myxococcales bacterium]|nr:MAG: DUF4439 domain-containing protein [Myxococcales bacterium]